LNFSNEMIIGYFDSFFSIYILKLGFFGVTLMTLFVYHIYCMNKILALVGMCGTGKSVVADYFEKKSFSKVYFGGVTMDELAKRGLEVNETNEKAVREELRATYGMAAYAILSLPKIENAVKDANVIIDGLYGWSEYKVLKEKFGNQLIVISITSPLQDRYERLEQRKIRPLTNEEARQRDYAEIENLEKGGPIAIADYTIINDGTLQDMMEKLDRLSTKMDVVNV
jgi:dephospho-CoA kinase